MLCLPLQAGDADLVLVQMPTEKLSLRSILSKILIKTPIYGMAVRIYYRMQRLQLPKVIAARKKRLLSKRPGNTCKKKGERLNIVQISTIDNYGGAALVAFRLHRTYNALGHNSVMLVGDKMSDDAKVMSIRDPEDITFREMCNQEGLHYWNYLSSFDLPMKTEFEQADILHFHNIHGDYFTYQALQSLTRLKPALWTLHDMQSVTGHCAFALDCRKWETGCGECPRLEAYPALRKDMTAFLWRDKKDAYSGASMDIAVPSNWLRAIAGSSILSDKDIHLIYNGVDTALFRPRAKSDMRKKLGIEPGKTVLITSAAGGTRNSQKGGAYLLEALRNLRLKEDVVVVSIGEKESNHDIPGIQWINTGHLFCEEDVAEWYSAADLFLYTSLADNCPLVILEAMASGLPIVTFATGGIPELVSHGETGYVAKYRDTADFIKGVELFLAEEGLRRAAGKSARQIAETRFSFDRMAADYLSHYYRVIEKRAGTQ